MKKAHAIILLTYLRKTAAFVFLIALLAITADVLRFVTMIVASPTIGPAGTSLDRPYEQDIPGADMRILIAGDSTAVGVGAYTPKETIAGRLSIDFPDTDIENIAVSGAKVVDVVGQFDAAEGRYAMILVQVGANDIIYFSDESEIQTHVWDMMRKAYEHSGTIVVLAPFDVSIVPLLPRLLSPVFATRSSDILETMREVVEDTGGIFIDLYKSEEEKQFAAHTDTFFSADSFHPSSDGYALAYARIKKELCEREIFLTLCGR
jgi:lysophospholipase L1-like esterase